MAIPGFHHDADVPSHQAGVSVVAISAVTLVTTDMVRAVRFYEALGFRRTYGGPDATFTSFAVGGNYLNLMRDHLGRELCHRCRGYVQTLRRN